MEQRWIFIAFLLAFAVKVPMWPVHTWLPDAHVEAPTGGSVILAAIMLKMGGYGFLRFSLPIAPDASRELDMLMIALSLIAVVYIGFVALVQQDMKKLIAYSSIAHMGFVTLGAFIAYDIVANTGSLKGAAMGIDGAMVQMISHGLISGALFLCVGVMYDRMHSREISAYGGVINTMPKFAAFMVLFALANTGLPGTSGFVGEFLVILASFKANFWYALLAATTLVLGAAYTLWLVKRVVFGPVANDNVAELAGPEWPRVHRARRARPRRAGAGCVAGAAARHHGGVGPSPGGPGRGHQAAAVRRRTMPDNHIHLGEPRTGAAGDLSHHRGLRGADGGRVLRRRRAAGSPPPSRCSCSPSARRSRRVCAHVGRRVLLFDGLYVAD